MLVARNALFGVAWAGCAVGLQRAAYLAMPFELAWLASWPAVMAVALAGGALGALGGWRLGPRRDWAWLGGGLPLAVGLAPGVNAGLLLGAAVAGVGLAVARSRAADWLPAVLAGLAVLLAYLGTAAPSLLLGDTGVFQVAAATLDIPHPTGYPLLMLAGHGLGWLFPGNTPFAITLLSIGGGALACGFVYLWLRWSDVPAPLAAALAPAPGLLPRFWGQAVLGEAYPLHVAFAVLAIAAGCAALEGKRGPWLALAALGVGLGLAHHRVIVLAVPAVVVAFALALWFRRWRTTWRELVTAAVTLAAPILTYAYLPWRQPGMSWDEFRAIVLADRFAGFLSLTAPLTDPAAPGLLVDRTVALLPWPLLLLAGAGWLALVRWRWPLAVVAGVLVGPHLYFAVAYRVPDAAVYLLTLVPTAFWLAASLWRAVPPLLARMAPAASGGHLQHAALALALLAGLAVWATTPATLDAVDLSGDRQALDTALMLPVDRLPRDSVIIADLARYVPALYASRVLYSRSDVRVLLPEDEALARAVIDREIRAGRPPWLARQVPALARDHSFNALGGLTLLTPPTAPPTGTATILAVFEPNVALVQAITPRTTAADGILKAAVAWRALGQIDPRYWPRLVAVDTMGNRTVLRDGQDPVNDLRATPHWRPGEEIQDAYFTPLRGRLAPGTVRLELEMAVPFSPQTATVRGGGPVLLGETAIAPGAPGNPLARRVQASAGAGLLLTGVEPEGADRLLLRWLAAESVGGAELEIGVRAGPEATRTRVRLGPDVGGSFGTVVPAPAGSEPRTVSSRLLTPAGETVMTCGFPLLPCAGVVVPGNPPAPPGVASFAGLAALEAATVMPPRDRSEPVRVELTWRRLQSIRQDYTVSVQVLNARGELVAQVDRPPGNGHRPTSGWRPDERIADHVAVPLPGELPAGAYRVIVRMYSAATATRLPVVDGSGRAMADEAELGTFALPP